MIVSTESGIMNAFKDLNCNDSDEDNGDSSDDDDKNDNDEKDDDNNIKCNDHKNNDVDNATIVKVPLDFNLNTDSDQDTETLLTNPDETIFNNNGKKISKKKMKLLAIQNALSVPASESGSGSSERSKVGNHCMHIVIRFFYKHTYECMCIQILIYCLYIYVYVKRYALILHAYRCQWDASKQ
jgi:hypothetical protein